MNKTNTTDFATTETSQIFAELPPEGQVDTSSNSIHPLQRLLIAENQFAQITDD